MLHSSTGSVEFAWNAGDGLNDGVLVVRVDTAINNTKPSWLLGHYAGTCMSMGMSIHIPCTHVHTPVYTVVLHMSRGSDEH